MYFGTSEFYQTCDQEEDTPDGATFTFCFKKPEEALADLVAWKEYLKKDCWDLDAV